MRSAIKCKLKNLSAEVAKLHRQAVPAPCPQDTEEFKKYLKRNAMINRWAATGDANDLPEDMREYAPVFERFLQERRARNECDSSPEVDRMLSLLEIIDGTGAEAAETPSTTPAATPAPPIAPPAASTANTPTSTAPPPAPPVQLPSPVPAPEVALTPAVPAAPTPARLLPRLW